MFKNILNKIKENTKTIKKACKFFLEMVSIISLVISIYANHIATSANEISQSANDIALEANNLAVSANELSESANQISNQALFYSRLEQPLTYTYDFSFEGNDLQAFDNYAIPSVYCKLNISTGAPTRVAVINCDNGIENMYDYNSKFGAELLNDITAEFLLPFTSVLECENIKYQYIYIYIEGVDSTWNLDCIVLQYDPITTESSISILDELDVLRLNYEKDEVTIKILNEYKNLFENISEIKNIG